MDPISGFVTAAVGDVALNFGKGVVSAFLEARRKSRSTFVNGVRVGSRLVGDGDEIRLGSFPLNLYLA